MDPADLELANERPLSDLESELLAFEAHWWKYSEGHRCGASPPPEVGRTLAVTADPRLVCGQLTAVTMTKHIVAVTMSATSRAVRPSTSIADRTVRHTSLAQFMGITSSVGRSRSAACGYIVRSCGGKPNGNRVPE